MVLDLQDIICCFYGFAWYHVSCFLVCGPSAFGDTSAQGGVSYHSVVIGGLNLRYVWDCDVVVPCGMNGWANWGCVFWEFVVLGVRWGS